MVQKSESIRANCIWWKVGFSPAPILVYFLWHFSTCHIRIEEIWRTISHAKTIPQHVGVGSNMLYKILLEKWQYHNYDIAFHIFQNAQVTSNKIVHKKRHHFLAQFSIPFHMVWSVLFRVLAQKTWLVEILWRFYSMVFEANTCSKKDHSTWKWKGI